MYIIHFHVTVQREAYTLVIHGLEMTSVSFRLEERNGRISHAGLWADALYLYVTSITGKRPGTLYPGHSPLGLR